MQQTFHRQILNSCVVPGARRTAQGTTHPRFCVWSTCPRAPAPSPALFGTWSTPLSMKGAQDLGSAAHGKSAHGRADAAAQDSLSRHTVAVLATLSAFVLLVPAAVSWQRHAGCDTQRSPGAAQHDGAADRDSEAPDSATFAICVIMNVPPYDPQWVDGRAEECTRCADVCMQAEARPC